MSVHETGNLIRSKGLGVWGYVLAILQLVGFAFGGAGVLFWSLATPYCPHCSRYLRKMEHRDRFASDETVIDEDIERFQGLVAENELEEALFVFREETGDVSSIGHQFRLRLTISVCPGYQVTHLDLNVLKRSRTTDDWSEIHPSGKTRLAVFMAKAIRDTESDRRAAPMRRPTL